MSIPAQAWDHHHALMENIINSLPALEREYLSKGVAIPTALEEKEMIHHIATELQLNEAKIPVFTEAGLPAGEHVSANLAVRDLLEGDFIDEPDLGMDQDLPDSADPQNERAWMGGKTGPTSQGFRHMFFAGMEFQSPLQTLQIPFHAIGQAPSHYEKLHALSQRFFKEGNVFWGTRTLLWSLHIMQDLHQPFHVTQIPTLKMVPWHTLFSHFIARTTQAIANYHYAYEGLILEYVREARTNSFHECFEVKEAKPLAHIEDVIQNTRTHSEKIGQATYAVFGNELTNPEVNLPENKGQMDYYALIHSKEDLELQKDEAKDLPESELALIKKQLERVNALKQLRLVTCDLMRSMSEYTWGELDRAFHYPSTSNSSNSGK